MNTSPLLKKLVPFGFTYFNESPGYQFIDHNQFGNFLLSKNYRSNFAADIMQKGTLELSNCGRYVAKKRWQDSVPFSTSSFDTHHIEKVERFLVAFCTFCQLQDYSTIVKSVTKKYNPHVYFNKVNMGTELHFDETMIINQRLECSTLLSFRYTITQQNFFKQMTPLDSLLFFVFEDKVYLHCRSIDFSTEIDSPEDVAFFLLQVIMHRWGVLPAVKEYCQTPQDLNGYIAIREMMSL